MYQWIVPSQTQAKGPVSDHVSLEMDWNRLAYSMRKMMADKSLVRYYTGTINCRVGCIL